MTQTAEIHPIQPKEEKAWPVIVQKLGEAVDMRAAEYWTTIKATCGLANAPDTSVMAFLLTAKKYGLDPIVRQIYAFEKGGKIVPIVSIDGWLGIINEHAQTDGMEFIDNFDENKKIFSITCKLYRKDRKVPVEVTEYLSECQMDTQPWKKWPIRMLRHKAAIQAARYAFGLSGIYDPDEGQRIIETDLDPKEHADNHIAEISNIIEQKPKEAKTVDLDTNADWYNQIDNEIVPGLQNCKTKKEISEFVSENDGLIKTIGDKAPAEVKDYLDGHFAKQLQKVGSK